MKWKDFFIGFFSHYWEVCGRTVVCWTCDKSWHIKYLVILINFWKAFYTKRTIWKPVKRSTRLSNILVSTWKRVSTKRNLWIDHRTISFLRTWKFLINNDNESNSYKHLSRKTYHAETSQLIRTANQLNNVHINRVLHIEL